MRRKKDAAAWLKSQDDWKTIKLKEFYKKYGDPEEGVPSRGMRKYLGKGEYVYVQKELAKTITRAREELGLSRMALAKRIGIDGRYVDYIEVGYAKKRRVRAEVLALVMSYLGVSCP